MVDAKSKHCFQIRSCASLSESLAVYSICLFIRVQKQTTKDRSRFLLSLLAVKRDIAVTILVRCMCMHVCVHVRADMSGP